MASKHICWFLDHRENGNYWFWIANYWNYIEWSNCWSFKFDCSVILTWTMCCKKCALRAYFTISKQVSHLEMEVLYLTISNHKIKSLMKMWIPFQWRKQISDKKQIIYSLSQNGIAIPVHSGVVHSQKYGIICLTEANLPEYQCYYRYRWSFYFRYMFFYLFIFFFCYYLVGT